MKSTDKEFLVNAIVTLLVILIIALCFLAEDHTQASLKKCFAGDSEACGVCASDGRYNIACQEMLLRIQTKTGKP